MPTTGTNERTWRVPDFPHMASKNVALQTIAEQIAKVDARIERGFAAVASDAA